MDEPKASGKSFDISKREVWEAWERVKANKGAPGVDGCSTGDFEKDLKNNLYKEPYSKPRNAIIGPNYLELL